MNIGLRVFLCDQPFVTNVPAISARNTAQEMVFWGGHSVQGVCMLALGFVEPWQSKELERESALPSMKRHKLTAC